MGYFLDNCPLICDATPKREIFTVSTTRGLRDTTWYNRYIPLQHATTIWVFWSWGTEAPPGGFPAHWNFDRCRHGGRPKSPKGPTSRSAWTILTTRWLRGNGYVFLFFFGIQFGPLSGPAKSWWFFKIPPNLTGVYNFEPRPYPSKVQKANPDLISQLLVACGMGIKQYQTLDYIIYFILCRKLLFPISLQLKGTRLPQENWCCLRLTNHNYTVGVIYV